MEKLDSLGIYMFLRNGDFYDYPWRESLESAIPVADKIVVNECFSDKDNTYEELQKFAARYPDKIDIVRSDWVDNYLGLAALGNYCVPFLHTDWSWQLQADEVIHENSYPLIRQLLSDTPVSITAATVNYRHLVANYSTEFDFMYKSLIRIARRGGGWVLTGDACQLDGGNKSTVLGTSIEVMHYGKVHAGKDAWKKEWDFQQLFTDIGFPDPKMLEMKEKFGEQFCDYLFLFEEAVKRGEFRKFEGTHPAVMHDRIAKAKLEGWEQFSSRIKQELFIQ